MARNARHETPRTDSHPGEGAVRGTQRMEYFADAVFAISLTLPIFALVVPAPGPGFAARLAALWPAYLGYGLSALVIGTYWAQHHFSGAIYRTSGHHFLVATLLFLVAVAFIAFPTRAFAEQLPHPASRAPAAILYAWALAALAVTWLLKWRTGCATEDVDDRLEPAYVARLTRLYAWRAAIAVAGATLASVRWEAGLALTLGVTLLYLRAPETPEYRTRAPRVQGAE